MKKTIRFKEDISKVTITLEDEKGNPIKSLDIENHSITGSEIYTFLDFHKDDIYSSENESKEDSQQIKELKTMFASIAKKISDLSNTSQTNVTNTEPGKEQPENI